MTDHAWEIRSDTGSSWILSVAVGLLGALFIYLTKGHMAPSESSRAAFWLGVMLVGLCAASLIMMEDIVVMVDPASKRLEFRRSGYWRQSSSVVGFEGIDHVGVVETWAEGKVGSTYTLTVVLKNGKSERTGRWSFDESEIDALARRLAADIGCACRTGTPAPPISAIHIPAAALGSILIYVVWYRLRTGQTCPAMWHGSAPPVIILIAFATLLDLFRRFWR